MAKQKPVYARKGEKIMKALQEVGYRHTNWQVFQDFLAMSAVAISNSVDWTNAKQRESEYLEIVKRYNKEELERLTGVLALLVTEMTEEQNVGGPCDILGEVFHGLELHNKYKGQFFTPFNVCHMMGRMTVTDVLEEELSKREYISLCEPCVGAGGMVLGFARAMHEKSMDYQRNLLVTACDIDIKCVHMAYLQLGLYGIPAVIIHGNSLSCEE